MDLTLVTAGAIFRDPYYRKSPTRHEQDLNLHINWVGPLSNEVVE